MGITLRELIFDHCGGLPDGRRLKAIVPGGSSVPVLGADQVDVRLDFDSVAQAGSMLGSAGVIVMDDSTCMVRAIARIAKFYAEESCGQCTQCREGTGWMYKIARRIADGAGRVIDLDILEEQALSMGMMPGMSICGLADGAAWPVRTVVQKFRQEFEQRISAQAPDAAERRIRQTNPAAYEEPIRQGRETQYIGGTFIPP
jgi:NADH-quinone oxidoreductase subunit F